MKITVVKEETRELEKFYVIRAIRDTGCNKKCIAERLYNEEPTEEQIGLFLYESNADFCSVVTNYRFRYELPFC